MNSSQSIRRHLGSILSLGNIRALFSDFCTSPAPSLSWCYPYTQSHRAGRIRRDGGILQGGIYSISSRSHVFRSYTLNLRCRSHFRRMRLWHTSHYFPLAHHASNRTEIIVVLSRDKIIRSTRSPRVACASHAAVSEYYVSCRNRVII